jgi:hypothetical protein
MTRSPSDALMEPQATWRTVYNFWFPPGLDDADLETHRRMFGWWFGGGARPELPPFAQWSKPLGPAAWSIGPPYHAGACR